ncbi:hypothetical protein FRC04_007007 [Tulasnella sp. 424]|nr:hypothetical protein FRC04_007007 [Tulasnella sp. 424]KAG8973047.1 hypothetical protein FRC05_009162 [Tulasnella sp. 425]
MALAAGAAVAIGLAVGALARSKEDERRRQHEAQLEAIDARTRRDKAYWMAWHQRRPGVSRHLSPSPRPLRLLSLDGGGVRGIISLIILEQVMREVAPGAKPCEWFDLIGGTSTGGLIAIMLGRLRMSIPECIAAYHELAKEVFDVNSLDVAVNLFDRAKFSGTKLQQAVETVVERYRGGTSTKMWDNPERRSENERVCRTFVVAIPGCDVPRPPKLFRTYNNRFQHHSTDHCEVWEAVQATLCAPSFFPEIKIDRVYYSDGGLGYSNPTKLMLQEAQSLWGPNQKIGCLLSLGTGSVDSFMKRSNDPLDFVKFLGICKRMALGCDAVHQEMMNDQLVSPFYYRFNPTMKENVSLDEWKQIRELEEIARQYLAENYRKVAGLASSYEPQEPTTSHSTPDSLDAPSQTAKQRTGRDRTSFHIAPAADPTYHGDRGERSLSAEELVGISFAPSSATGELVDLLEALGRVTPQAVRNKHKIHSIVRVAHGVYSYIIETGNPPGGQKNTEVKHSLERMEKYCVALDALEETVLEFAEALRSEITEYGPELFSTWLQSRSIFTGILNKLDQLPSLGISYKAQDIAEDSFFDDCSWLSHISRGIDAQLADVPKTLPVLSVTDGLHYLESQIKFGAQNEQTRELVIDITTLLAQTLASIPLDLEPGFEESSLAAEASRDRLIKALADLFSTIDLDTPLETSTIQELAAKWTDVKAGFTLRDDQASA